MPPKSGRARRVSLPGPHTTSMRVGTRRFDARELAPWRVSQVLTRLGIQKNDRISYADLQPPGHGRTWSSNGPEVVRRSDRFLRLDLLFQIDPFDFG